MVTNMKKIDLFVEGGRPKAKSVFGELAENYIKKTERYMK